ncbi:MAG: serine protease, partial [Coriobacteriia bacterium]|nr:serine protease [Coriobacteriia bacterium]
MDASGHEFDSRPVRQAGDGTEPADQDTPPSDDGSVQPSGETEPFAEEGEAIAWMADADTHLSDLEGAGEEPSYPLQSGPLPVCEYTGEGDEEPCEEPATVRRWSSAAVVVASVFGAIVGGILVAGALVFALGAWPGLRPAILSQDAGRDTGAASVSALSIEPGVDYSLAEAVSAKVTPSVVNVNVQQVVTDLFTGTTQLTDVGNGSGVIVRSDGYVVTNYHV